MTNASQYQAVYQCDVCKRRIKVPVNQLGLDVLAHCIITENCLGYLHVVNNLNDRNNTPIITPSVPGLQDWFPRKVLYTWDQTIARSTWNVPHNLGSQPLVEVAVNRIDSNGNPTQIMLPPDSYQVIVVDLNNITINFTRNETGVAQCIATASANKVNPIQQVTPTVNDMILTNNGQLTIATLDTSMPLQTNLVFVANNTIVVNYSVNGVSSSLSPWDTTTTIRIGSNNYIVRSFDVVNDPSPPTTAFTSGAIVNGNPCYVTFGTIGTLPPPAQTPNVNFILLAKPPFASTDVITTSVIDLASISYNQPQLYYANGNMYAQGSIIKNIYPPVIAVE